MRRPRVKPWVERIQRALAKACPSLFGPLWRCKRCGTRLLARDRGGHLWRCQSVSMAWKDKHGEAWAVFFDEGPAR